MTAIRLLVVPYEHGALRMGVGRGPERLLEAGAFGALASRGADVHVEILELQEDLRGKSGDSEVNAGFDLIRQVASRVGDAVASGAFPVLLSGSCFAGVGVAAGMGEEAPGVVWFDAHGDLNRPETAVDGYFDGMGIAILTGNAWQGMRAGVPGAPPVPESAVVLAGARALEEPEQVTLASSEIVHLPPEEIDTEDAVARAAGALQPQPSGLYVHVDLDVLDREEARVNIYGAADGLSGAELESQVRSLLDSCPVRAVSLTAYDPEVDSDGRVPPIAIRLLEAVAQCLEQAR
jgi:arginase